MPIVTKSPSAAKNVSRGGLAPRSWKNETLVFESDSSAATLSSNMTSTSANTHYLMCSGFGFQVPNEATIIGITCHVNARSSKAGSIEFSEVSLTTNYEDLVGNNLADDFILPTDFMIKDFGGDSELWGLTLTPSIINNTNFGVAFAFEWVTGAHYVHVDHIQITVHYEEKSGLGMFTKVSSTIKSVDKGYTKVGGVWKPVEKSLKKVSGTWKE